MNSVEKIKQVVASGVLLKSMMVIPDFGATDSEILTEERKMNRKISNMHRNILKEWNGTNFDVVRFYGCGDVHKELRVISDSQVADFFSGINALIFADDPAGFLYSECENGFVFSVQVNTGKVKKIAKNIDDFICRLVFGVDAELFGGKTWKAELIEAGVI